MAEEKNRSLRDDLSMDDLETPRGKEDAGPEKPEKPERKPREKLSDADRSRAMGVAATAVCVGLLAFFVISQIFFTGRGAAEPEGPGNTAPVRDVTASRSPADLDEDGNPVLPAPDGSAGSGASYDPYNRAPWDYRLVDEDGVQAVDERGSDAPGGARYIIRDRDGTDMYHISVPAGYTAYDNGLSVDIAAGDMSVTGNEPLTLVWQTSVEIRALLEYGEYDYLAHSGTAGYAAYGLSALGYYMFDDGAGTPYPVVTAKLSRTSSDPDLAGLHDFDEYWIVVGWPSENGQYLVGRVPADSFEGMKSRLYPNVTALAKAMFPACEIPDFPSHWFPSRQQIPDTPAPGPAPDGGTPLPDGTDAYPG